MKHKPLNQLLALTLSVALSACSSVQYHPLPAMPQIDTQHGYRILNTLETISESDDDTIFIVLFSGGGTRAAALGYGVLRVLEHDHLLDNIDMVYGVSGGAVLAAYYSLTGKAGLPNFKQHFLQQDFQTTLKDNILAVNNWSRLLSPEYGRGDLLEEQLDNLLFHHHTYADLVKHRQGPFAVITATDMGAGQRLNFIQEFFDPMCINLSDLPIARAVAASAAVPLIFSPITLNNHGGQCHYQLPNFLHTQLNNQHSSIQHTYLSKLNALTDSQQRPYLHLVDGGLTDNLGLSSLLDIADIIPPDILRAKAHAGKIKRIVVMSVNASTRSNKAYDQSPAIPGLAAVIAAIVDIPIDQNSATNLQRFQQFTTNWNQSAGKNPVQLYFISLNLTDLADSPLKTDVLNLPTSFSLPDADLNKLETAAQELLNHSSEYQRYKRDSQTHTSP